MCLVAAGDEVIGELHVIKWPIAKILVVPKQELWRSTNHNHKTSNGQQQSNRNQGFGPCVKVDLGKCGEVLLRYQHTPSVVASRTMLVYTQVRSHFSTNLHHILTPV